MDSRPTELALFAGAGGGLLASRWLLGHRVVCYVERDPYCVRVLRARIADGLIDDAPIWDDVRTFDGRPWRGLVDVVSAGFPCQPFSAAGKRHAGDDERNGWPDTIRVLREVRPALAFLENVPGLLAGSHGYFGRVLGDLAESGFDAEWGVLSAGGVGAPHKRARLWIVAADADRRGRRIGRVAESAGVEGARGREPDRLGAVGDEHHAARMADPERHGPQGLVAPRTAARAIERGGVDVPDTARERLARADDAVADDGGQPDALRVGWWSAEPPLGRVAHGLADRVGQLRALGNGQVPLVAAVAWRMLTERARVAAREGGR